MSETYVITFHVRPAQRTRFLALLNSVLDNMRDESTFLHAALHVDPEDENRFELHETWSDRRTCSTCSSSGHIGKLGMPPSMSFSTALAA